MKPITILYEYHNVNHYPITMLLAWPNDILYGAPVQIIELTHEPEMVSIRDQAGNQFAVVVVYPNERMRFEYEVKRNPRRRQELSDTEREYYLTAQEIGNFPEELVQRYLGESRHLSTDREQATTFYQALIRDFAFQDLIAPSQRIQNPYLIQKLESIDFARLFALLCRRSNIPCRILYGSLSARMYRPHAWNEVYLESEGWVPVDVALGRLHSKQLKRADELFLPDQKWEEMFGHIPEVRPIFAIQLESGDEPSCAIFDMKEQSPTADQLWGIAIEMDKIAWYPPPVLFLEEETKASFVPRLKRILYFFLIPEMSARPFLFFNGDWKVIRTPLLEWSWRSWIYTKNLSSVAFLLFAGSFFFGANLLLLSKLLLVALLSGGVSQLIKASLGIRTKYHLLGTGLFGLLIGILFVFV